MREFAESPKGNLLMTATEPQAVAPRRAIEPAASVPVSGLIDPGDGYALVHVNGYRPSPADVYVSAGQLKQYGLRKGDRIEATARPSAGGRAKYRPLVSVDTVNGLAPELARPPGDPLRGAGRAIGGPGGWVGAGGEGLVLLAPIARRGPAYNLAAPPRSRTLAGGVAVSALLPPRQFLGAARNIEYGGSLTIVSTPLVDTRPRIDDVPFQGFKGTANMELRLRHDLPAKRRFPA